MRVGRRPVGDFDIGAPGVPELRAYASGFANGGRMTRPVSLHALSQTVINAGQGVIPASGNMSRPEELSANELIWKLFERSVR